MEPDTPDEHEGITKTHSTKCVRCSSRNGGLGTSGCCCCFPRPRDVRVPFNDALVLRLRGSTASEVCICGDWYGAIRHQQLALLVAERIPLRLTLLPLEHAALAAHRIGRSNDALVLLAFVEAQRKSMGLRRSAQFDQYFSEQRRAVVIACGARAVESEAIGSSLGSERAVEIAFALPIEPTRPSRLAALTDRERDVALLVGDGASNREIAEKLVISQRTAENHLAAIFVKLDVTRRAHVAMVVREERTKGLAAEQSS